MTTTPMIDISTLIPAYRWRRAVRRGVTAGVIIAAALAVGEGVVRVWPTPTVGEGAKWTTQLIENTKGYGAQW